MLFILTGLFLFIVILLLFFGESGCEDIAMIFFVCFIICLLVLFITLLSYNAIKTINDKQIVILEERNEIVLKQIALLVDKYLNYETETLSKFKVDVNNLVALSMFPELKGNEFVKSQIDIVIKNQDGITKLKLQKARLNAYKLWLFMGE